MEKIIHTESRTFEKKSHASTLAKESEVKLDLPDAVVGRSYAKPMTIKQVQVEHIFYILGYRIEIN